MNTIEFILLFYYIFSVIIEESRLLRIIINDIYSNIEKKLVDAIIITITIIIIAPISFPILIGKMLYEFFNK